MALESSNHQKMVRRKVLRFKNVDFTATGTNQLFKPFNGKVFIVDTVLTRTTKTGGTITTQPQFKITDGTNDIVAAAANMNANQGRAKKATVITDRPATFGAPLTLVITTAAAGTGGPVFKGDIIIEGFLM